MTKFRATISSDGHDPVVIEAEKKDSLKFTMKLGAIFAGLFVDFADSDLDWSRYTVDFEWLTHD